MDAKLVGSRIRDIRQQRGLTQAELAQQVNMSLKHISAIECGIRLPSLDTLIAVANELQIDTNPLLQDFCQITVFDAAMLCHTARHFLFHYEFAE